jgi:hypothetical protein
VLVADLERELIDGRVQQRGLLLALRRRTLIDGPHRESGRPATGRRRVRQDTQPRTGSRGFHVRLRSGHAHSHARPRRRGVHPGRCDEGCCHRAQHGHHRSVRIALLAPSQPTRHKMLDAGGMRAEGGVLPIGSRRAPRFARQSRDAEHAAASDGLPRLRTGKPGMSGPDTCSANARRAMFPRGTRRRPASLREVRASSGIRSSRRSPRTGPPRQKGSCRCPSAVLQQRLARRLRERRDQPQRNLRAFCAACN